jgi:hypothetical protein
MLEEVEWDPLRQVLSLSTFQHVTTRVNVSLWSSYGEDFEVDMKKVKEVVCRRVSPSGDEDEKFHVSVDDDEAVRVREGKLLDKVRTMLLSVCGGTLINFAWTDAKSDCPWWMRGCRDRTGGYLGRVLLRLSLRVLAVTNINILPRCN